jgi:hypothetical protein
VEGRGGRREGMSGVSIEGRLNWVCIDISRLIFPSQGT